MYHENESPVDSLVHLYVDGAFNRRELVRRAAKYTGSLAAAVASASKRSPLGSMATRVSPKFTRSQGNFVAVAYRGR